MNLGKSKKILLESGSFLGRGEGCLILSDRKRNVEKYPLFENEICEVRAKMGSTISVGALVTCAFWGINVILTTQRGNPTSYLRSLTDDGYVSTRIAQYAALKNGKGIAIAKTIVWTKAQSENELLKKLGLRQHDLAKIKQSIVEIDSPDLKVVSRKLQQVEGHYTNYYFNRIFPLLPQSYLKTERRKTFRAYDGLNNSLNLVYTMLKWKIHMAVVKANLEPFLGFIHSEEIGKPSLVCDLQEIYRSLIDDYLITFCKGLTNKDFELVEENFTSNKKGKRQYLKRPLAQHLMKGLDQLFETKVNVARLTYGHKQELESLIGEESSQLAKFLRNEKKEWIPRIPQI